MTNLVEAGVKGGNAPKHKWTDDERDIVRRDWGGTNRTSQIIADYLSVLTGETITLDAVKGQAAKMGIMNNRSPDWSDEEIEQLTEMITQYSPITIAKRLKRSLNAVVMKARTLGLSVAIRDGWFTQEEVCQLLGVHHRLIGRHIATGALRALRDDGKHTWHIKVHDLIKFIRNNAHDFQGRNVDLVMIVYLLNDKL